MSGWLFHEAECNGVSPSLFYNKKHKTHTKLLQFSRTSVENDTTIDNWLLLSQWIAKHFLSTLKRLNKISHRGRKNVSWFFIEFSKNARGKVWICACLVNLTWTEICILGCASKTFTHSKHNKYNIFFINKVLKRSVGVQTSDMFCLYFIPRYRFLYTSVGLN